MVDYGYYDIHSHVLYGMDDGARSIEASIALCDMAQATGTDFLFLTPHITDWNSASLLYDAREERTEYLQNILYDEGIDLKLYKGFEILCDDEIFSVEYFKPYTMNDSRYLLIEFNFYSTTEDDVKAWCSYILSKGLVPIIAHPERYDFVKNDISVFERLSDMGCLFQMNCGSAVGVFGDATAEIAERMLFAGYVDFIGSDAHDYRWRNTDMAVFLEDFPEDIDDELLYRALKENPERLVQDLEIFFERGNL